MQSLGFEDHTTIKSVVVETFFSLQTWLWWKEVLTWVLNLYSLFFLFMEKGYKQ